MQVEIGMAGHPVVMILGEPLAHAQDVGHEAPAPFIGHFMHMAQETGEGEPAIGLHHHGFGPAAE